MSTRETIQSYFEKLKQKKDWQSSFADETSFGSYTSPVREVKGKAAFLESTKRFYSTIKSFEIRGLLIDGDQACALTRYELQSPTGSSFTSDVAEIFSVKNGKIQSFGIYFDTAPFPK
jgi:ketosteroid isomerase-like protein